MFDVVLGIAMLIAIVWWFGRDTSPSGPPPPKSPPDPSRPTSGATAPREGPAPRPPEATPGDDAFIDGLIIGAYGYGHWGRDADEGSADPLPALGDDGFGGGDEVEDDEFDDDLGGGFDDPFGFDDDFDL